MNIALIGHRGEPESYPENSLAGFEAVLAAGARYIETDVQLTVDGVPVLSHDASLLRITGQDRDITASRYGDIWLRVIWLCRHWVAAINHNE